MNFFPSTTLAYAYFENFVKPICTEYYKENTFWIDKKPYKNFKFQIIIPEELSEDINGYYQMIKNSMSVKESQVRTPSRMRTFSIDTKELENEKLEIFDFPTTLTGINYAIRELLPEEYRMMGQEYKDILARELDKLIITLQKLINISTIVLLQLKK